MHWHQLEVKRANEIIELNKDKKKVQSLEDFAFEIKSAKEDEKVFANVVGQDSLTRFDKAKKKRKNRNNRNNRRKKPSKNA